MSTVTASDEPITAYKQARLWYVESRQHNVAHGQVSTRAEHYQLWSKIVAGVLAVFTGTVWTADLADTGLLSSTTVQWVAAMAAFASAILLAITSAHDWKKDADEHMADKLLWAKVDSDIEQLAFERDGIPNERALARLRTHREQAIDGEHNLTPHQLARAGRWLKKHRPDVYR